MIARLRSCPQIECGDKVMEYEVRPGDTVSGIAAKFGIDEDTIRWENNLADVKTIKPGQLLRILPVVGIAHKVSRGETIYSIAKKYQAGSQGMVDFPFNIFTNDDFFLGCGAGADCSGWENSMWYPGTPICMWRPDSQCWRGVCTSQFIWPVGESLSQRYVWYHKGLDIAAPHGDAGAGSRCRTDNGERLAG